MPNTLFVVIKPDNDFTNIRTMVDGGDATATRNLFRIEQTTGNYGYFAGNVVNTGVVADAGYVLIRVEYNSTTGRIFRNGVQLGATANCGTRTMNGITLAASYAKTQHGSCRIARVLVYARKLSSYETADIESQLNTEYALW